MTRSIWKIIILIISIIVFAFSVQSISFSNRSSPIVATLPDISGLAWVEDGRFLAVHDAKDPSSARISLLSVPEDGKTLSWQSLTVNWPESSGIGKDLEAITAIPGTDFFLLAESGDRKPNQRLFLISYKNEKVKILAVTNWPVPVENVEAIAVTRVNDRYLFLYAERAENRSGTDIRWTTLTLDPLRFGEFRSVSFTSPFGSGEYVRQISDLALDSQGNLYIASTRDPGDKGAFRSAIYRIGRVSGESGVILDPNPRPLGEIDGLKVEGVTIQKRTTGDRLFFGTDDEDYGGVFRPLPEG
ncbi:hypothetical protein V0288_01625 [Pannus brasiliensis CCIBt3594]|uniref:Phytase-like domain-containing protein n=1 Tax=Pannus brasiliensis CCIBt3594 TaxID=1427578 RepID=A0AAW9QNK5_9CHRO